MAALEITLLLLLFQITDFARTGSWERWLTSLEYSHENTYFVVWCKEEEQIYYLEVKSVRIRRSYLLLSAPCSFAPLLWFKFISSQQQTKISVAHKLQPLCCQWN